MPYNTQHPDYIRHYTFWRKVHDCVEGERAVKAAGELYLPRPDPTNDSKENIAEYEQLLRRAMYLNITGRTKEGMIGAAFRKSAELELPPDVDYLRENATGSGQSIEQLAKSAVGEVLETGRGGILADYPAVAADRPLTRAESEGKRANLHLYPADAIVNWREEVIGNERKLTLVVLREWIEKVEDDLFAADLVEQHRVLYMDGGACKQRVYDEYGVYTEREVRGYDGKPFDHIPFHFIGAEENSAKVDKAPLADLADVNLLHYGNSATVEESAFIASQPTLFITTDMDQQTWAETNPGQIRIGSRRGYNLGEAGSANMVQASAEQLALELMSRKETQMVMIGARIIQEQNANETAEAAKIRHAASNSVLGTVVGNVSEAIKGAIIDAQRFMMAQPREDETEFWLNQEFFPITLDPQALLMQVQLWQQGVISKVDLRTNLRKAEIIDPERDDAAIDEDLLSEPPRLVDEEVDE